MIRVRRNSSLTAAGIQEVLVSHLDDSVAIGDGTGSLAGMTTNALWVRIKASDVATGGTSAVDEAAFTVATTTFTPIGGLAQTGVADSLLNGNAGVAAMTLTRDLHVNIRNNAGSEVTTWPVTGTFWQTTQPVSAASLPLPTGAAAEATLASLLTSSQLIDDVIFTDDAAFTPATSKVLAIGATFDNTAPDSVDEGDIGALRMTAARSLHVHIIGSDVASGGTSMVDEAAFTLATTTFTPVGGIAQTNTGDALLNGLGGIAAMTLTRDLHVNIRNNAGAEVTTWPVTGTFWQATQPVSGTFWQATQPISAASLPLPSGAATEATLLTLDDTQGTVAAGAAATKSELIGGVFNTALPTLTTGQQVALQMDSSGRIIAVVQGSVAVTGTFWQATQPVSAASLPLPSGASTEATLASLLTSSQLVDDIVVVDDAAFTPAVGKGVVLFGMADETTPDSVDEGDVGALRMTLARELLVKVNVALPAGTNNIGDVDVLTLPALAAGTNNIGDVDVLTLPALPAGTNNIGDIDVLSVTAAAATNKADIGLINAVTPLMGNGVTGTGSLRVTVASDNTAFPVNAASTGNVASDGIDSGNPVKIGFIARQANPTAVAALDRVDGMSDDIGRQVMVLNQVRDLVVHETTTISASVTETTILAAGAAGVFHDLVSLIITNSSATALIVTLKDATAGTTRAIYAIAANGGIVINFPTPLTQAAAAATWTLTCGTSVAAIYVHVVAVKNV